MKFKGKPTITCPNCGHRLLNAGNVGIKNGTIVAVVDNEDVESDYIIYCQKCKKYIALKNRTIVLREIHPRVSEHTVNG